MIADFETMRFIPSSSWPSICVGRRDALFQFPPDAPMAMPNRLNDQVLVRATGLEGHQALRVSRRTFVQSASAALVSLSVKSDQPTRIIRRRSFQLGLKLRDRAAFPPRRVEKHAVVIVGGGMRA